MRRVKHQLILAVAAVTLFACGSDPQPTSTGDSTVTIEAGDLYFAPEQLNAAAGAITIVVDNVGMAEHDVVIVETGDTIVVHANPGETATGTITLDAGTYTYYCSIPGHRASMTGELTVN